MIMIFPFQLLYPPRPEKRYTVESFIRNKYTALLLWARLPPTTPSTTDHSIDDGVHRTIITESSLVDCMGNTE